MNQYETMVIFREALSEDAVEKGIEEFKGAVVALGGEIDGSTRMGRKVFARKMDKQSAGEYALVRFKLEPLKVKEIKEKLRLSEYLFRMQTSVLNKAVSAGS